jgi:hypothetical protein
MQSGMHEHSTINSESADTKRSRPLHVKDLWARRFTKQWMDEQTLGHCTRILDFTGDNTVGSVWSPHLLKGDKRWLMSIFADDRYTFGIDALKLGLDNTSESDTSKLVLIPYIHFSSVTSFEIAKEHGVSSITFLILTNLQASVLKKFVDSIAKEPTK